MFSGMRLPGEHCVENRADAADQMIAQLSDLLRMTLENSGAQEVTLQQELDFLEQYVEIEHTRFQDRLTVHLDIAEEVRDARVPSFLLQPLVENAIRHGIAPRSEPGRIHVVARRENGDLDLLIQDNGRGFPAGASTAMLEGLGLGNTRARLEQLYGTAHRLDLSNAPEGGAVVHLSFPFNTIARDLD